MTKVFRFRCRLALRAEGSDNSSLIQLYGKTVVGVAAEWTIRQLTHVQFKRGKLLLATPSHHRDDDDDE